ncbi:MAG: hypothetical protein RSC41_03695, partial [Oscillospiraceae bacterium]
PKITSFTERALLDEKCLSKVLEAAPKLCGDEPQRIFCVKEIKVARGEFIGEFYNGSLQFGWYHGRLNLSFVPFFEGRRFFAFLQLLFQKIIFIKIRRE